MVHGTFTTYTPYMILLPFVYVNDLINYTDKYWYFRSETNLDPMKLSRNKSIDYSTSVGKKVSIRRKIMCNILISQTNILVTQTLRQNSIK